MNNEIFKMSQKSSYYQQEDEEELLKLSNELAKPKEGEVPNHATNKDQSEIILEGEGVGYFNIVKLRGSGEI